MRNKGLIFMTAVMLMLMMMLAGCGSASSGEGEEAATEATEETEEMAGMPNPWSDVATAEEAAEGAGIDGFEIEENMEISLGTVVPEGYRCMEGMAEADVPIAAVEMTIRKGSPEFEDVGPGDISGDYGEYANTWTQDVDGTEVTCFGNRKGEATKTIWKVGDYDYAILAYGAGGDVDYGLPADDVSILVKGIR